MGPVDGEAGHALGVFGIDVDDVCSVGKIKRNEMISYTMADSAVGGVTVDIAVVVDGGTGVSDKYGVVDADLGTA